MTINSIEKPRLYADFNKRDGDDSLEWLVLTCRGTFDDLARLNIQLTEGLRATFYMDDGDKMGHPDDLEADGYVHFDAGKNYWVAIIDWNSLRHASDRH